MSIPILVAVLSAAMGGLGCLLVVRILGRRVKNLETELLSLSEAVCQMADAQMSSHQKLSASMGEIEERILELTIPSRDSLLPLERRHQVLALARTGVALEEIIRRLGIPRGEAELIMSLNNHADSATPRASGPNGDLRRDENVELPSERLHPDAFRTSDLTEQKSHAAIRRPGLLQRGLPSGANRGGIAGKVASAATGEGPSLASSETGDDPAGKIIYHPGSTGSRHPYAEAGSPRPSRGVAGAPWTHRGAPNYPGLVPPVRNPGDQPSERPRAD